MKRIAEILERRFAQAIQSVAKQEFPAQVRPAAEERFGDWQVNGIMPAAKQLKVNPRALAEQVVQAVDLADICQKPEIAGPGFINLRLTDAFVIQRLKGMYADAYRLGIDAAAKPETVVVDYSGPNIAKEMHVGHLRSTIIGDCIARLYQFAGHRVIRQNHIGDWGTQFGMLIAYLKTQYPDILTNPHSARIGDLERFYQQAKQKDETDAAFAALARQQVVLLHQHHPETMAIWRHIVNQSRQHYLPIYRMLNVLLTEDDERGESFYADRLAAVVEELKAKGLAVVSDGAVCVFPPGFKNKDGQPLPMIIQKSDGAYLYATTDLAALRYRLLELQADRVIYVTDARQALHFQMVFATAQLAGWVRQGVALEHVTFGTMLGEDNKPFKTRTGGTVKLQELLDEAIARAAQIVQQKNPNLSEQEKQQIAVAVGIGAVKYADYSNNRNSDYVFSFDKMLAMDGNTAPYMQYAYARIKSIERRAAEAGIDIASEISRAATEAFTADSERRLAKQLIRYDQAITAAMAECRPNYLTSYLYDLATIFSRFYTDCPVITAEPSSRPLRLMLCVLTGRVIQHGLSDLLGIHAPDKM